MKKILKLSLVIAVLFAGISTYAIDGNGDSTLHVIKGDGNKVTFGLNNVTKAKLSIYDKEGTLIYSENAFSFEEFPSGTYFLEVEDSVKTIKHEITIKGDVTVISPKAISSVYKAGYSAKNTSVAVR
jgi:uncharacterized protein YxeA